MGILDLLLGSSRGTLLIVGLIIGGVIIFWFLKKLFGVRKSIYSFVEKGHKSASKIFNKILNCSWTA